MLFCNNTYGIHVSRLIKYYISHLKGLIRIHACLTGLSYNSNVTHKVHDNLFCYRYFSLPHPNKMHLLLIDDSLKDRNSHRTIDFRSKQGWIFKLKYPQMMQIYTTSLQVFKAMVSGWVVLRRFL